MAAWTAALALALFYVGYRVYARYIGERIYKDQETITVPAHEFEDGRDFVPTRRSILFGHHFTSIAGAAPIIGPCVAAYWGWLPALLWVVFGTIFIGAVHDFGALVASVREKGHSIGDIAGKVMSPRARLLFLSFVLVLVWLVLAVFAMAIAGLFVAQPAAVLPVNIEIVIALGMGWLLYRKKVNTLLPSIGALILLYTFVWLGTQMPLSFESLGLEAPAARKLWIVLLFIYSAIASLLPVWVLLQPRDYINSHQLFVGLGLLFLGLFIAQPEFDAPAWRTPGEESPALFPLLFVTIACGAISGFHGLVSSGTTSKQLNSLRDARLIGYGSMLGEGALALASTLAAVAGISLVGACELPGQGSVTDLSWAVYYDTWAHAGANKAVAFVLGGGAFLETLGLPTHLARTLMAVLVISFAATTLDTATRIQRFIIGEMGKAIKVPALENPYLATFLAVIPAAVLAFWDVHDPSSGAVRQAGWVLWPIFGASNQLLAALSLSVLALYFGNKGRNTIALIIPMLFVTAIALFALVAKLQVFLAQGNVPLILLASLLLALACWMLIESASAFHRIRQRRRSDTPNA